MVVDSLKLDEESAVYELSSRGALFGHLKRRFRNFRFSEYFDDVPPGSMKKGVPCQDVQDLRMGDDTFDLVTSTEVFEHVPDDLLGFSEVRRVLKRGGHLVFTVPLHRRKETLERARMDAEGKVVHLLGPEYHSDRLRGRRQVLAFRTYGMDIADRLRKVDLHARIEKIHSPANRIKDQCVIVAWKP
jgi:SAM-dependent methyltransferase